MNNLTLYNNLTEIENNIKNDNYTKVWETINNLKEKIYNEMLTENTSSSRKKAITSIQSLAKKIVKKNSRLILQYSHFDTINGVDGYLFTNSYIATFTKNNLTATTTEENKNQYPKLEKICDIECIYTCNADQLDYNLISLKSKLKDDNQDSYYELTFENGNTKKVKYLSSKYVKIAYDLLEINKSNNINIYINDNVHSCVKFENEITKEFVIIAPVHKF